MARLIYHPRGMFVWNGSSRRFGPFDITFSKQEMRTLKGSITHDLFARLPEPIQLLCREETVGRYAAKCPNGDVRGRAPRMVSMIELMIELIEPTTPGEKAFGENGTHAAMMSTLAEMSRRAGLPKFSLSKTPNAEVTSAVID